MVYCEQVRGKVPAYFGQCPGDINTKVLERMRKVLAEDKIYPYLMKNALGRLYEARKHCQDHGGVTTEPLINLGGDMWCLFPWLGTYALSGLGALFKSLNAQRSWGLLPSTPARPYFIQFKMKATREEFFEVLKEKESRPLDPMELVYPRGSAAF